MKRRKLLMMRAALLLMITLVISTFCLSLVWTGGVHGRSGDLLLGIYPGQVRIGWSEDWKNQTKWMQFRVDRSSKPLELGFVGGRTFAGTPTEMCIDFPIWIFLVPLLPMLIINHRRIRKLPRVLVCRHCDYLVGTSVMCSECGAPIPSKVTQQ